MLQSLKWEGNQSTRTEPPTHSAAHSTIKTLRSWSTVIGRGPRSAHRRKGFWVPTRTSENYVPSDGWSMGVLVGEPLPTRVESKCYIGTLVETLGQKT